MFHVKQLGLIGNPISHSLSPIIHKKISEYLNENINYKLEECEKINIDYLKENYDCFNVTMPFKKKIIPYINELSNRSKIIKSVNCVKNEKGILKGESTDGKGFVEAFKIKFNEVFENKNICIIGTGGSGKSLAFEIEKEGPKNIFYLSKSQKGKNIFSYNDLSFLEDCDIIINASPLGFINDESPCDDFFENQIVCDLIYGKKTKFLKEAYKKNCRLMDGLGMLVFQAIYSWEFWFNIKIDKRVGIKIWSEL